MAKGSTYTRGLCIVLNILLAIFGVILLLFGIVANSVKAAPLEGWTQGVFLSVGFGLATILLSILGVYGAYKEQVLPLLLYSVFMAIEFTVLMVLAIIATLAQPQLKREIEQSFGRMASLYNTDAVFQREINKLQQKAQCCGLDDYTDWKDEIPHSCFCPPDYPGREDKCVSVPKFHNNESCGPILTEYAKNCLRILLGILFTLATIEVAGVIAVLLLWYKIHTRCPGTDFSRDNDSRTKYELQPDKMP
ncbi:tetraspanin-6-like isoform X2 [Colossoma macropomum]|uniref:tetraspanin-6-like isoform X2 n=1 Tax=Colossoma macropomum TaxID=42526 RepID=UPI001863E333|nr:tetraspanin-6-like isoform X2 [Colossoma macropomum]